MEKKMKYNFELKLKFLLFFLFLWSHAPPTFPQKWILGGSDLEFYSNIFYLKFIKDNDNY